MRIEQFYLDGLGHQSYVILDENAAVAAVVDPRRDVEIYLQTADRAGARITHVLETHVHNDYVTGARELAARTGATIVNAASAELAYEHQPVHDGDRVRVGELTFEVIATPGHTPDHVSYAVYEPEHDRPTAVFTGGSMMIGSAGRTDLVSPGMTLTLTRAQYHSLRRLLDTLPEDVRVYPTHGAGSFCGATMGATPERYSTIGQERVASPAAHVHDETDFVRQQLAGYGVYPTYYGYMGEINQRGPLILGGVPESTPLAPALVRSNMEHGLPLIDGRSRRAFASEHVPGSLNIELDALFGIYVGWFLPFNKPLMLLVEDEEGRKEAVAQLIRIGFEQTRGHLDGGVAAWKAAGFPTGSFETIDVDELHRRWEREERLAVLDVRDATEWAAGHIPGSQHIHIGDMMRHLHEIPQDMPVATVCRSGHRASIAASIVAALGRQTISVGQGGVPDWIEKARPAEYDDAVPLAGAPHELEHVHP